YKRIVSCIKNDQFLRALKTTTDPDPDNPRSASDRAHLCHQFAPAMSAGATKNRPRTVNPEDDVDDD
ncbi:hypothetical protein pipiens_012841, partial [Culex pipiens pipiens]